MRGRQGPRSIKNTSARNSVAGYRGEGVLESAFDHYREVRGTVPERARLDHNPLDRKEYLLRVLRRVPTS